MERKMDLLGLTTLLFSDIHGKSERLARLLKLYSDTPAICLGDAVGMGENDATLRQLRERDIPCLLGNHEVDLIHLYEVSDENRRWLSTWPYQLREDDALLCHTWLRGRRFENIDSLSTVESMFASSDFRLTFVGHSHSPGWWELKQGDRPRWTHASQSWDVLWQEGSRYIIDVGSLGEPQSPGDPNYALWDEVGVRWLKLP